MKSLTERIFEGRQKCLGKEKLKALVINDLPEVLGDDSKRRELISSAVWNERDDKVSRRFSDTPAVYLSVINILDSSGFFDQCPEMKPLVTAVAGNCFTRPAGLKRILYAGEGLDEIGTEPFDNGIMEAFVTNYGKIDKGSLPEASLREAVLAKEPFGVGGLFACRGWRGEFKDQFNLDLDYYQAVGLISIGKDKSSVVTVSPIVEKAFESVDQNADDCGPGFVPFNHPMFQPRLALKHRFPNVPLKSYWDKKFNG